MPALLKVMSAVGLHELIMNTTEDGAHNQFFPIPMLHKISVSTIQCHNRAVSVTQFHQYAVTNTLCKNQSGAKIYWQLQYVHRDAYKDTSSVRRWVKHEHQQSIMLWSAQNHCM